MGTRSSLLHDLKIKRKYQRDDSKRSASTSMTIGVLASITFLMTLIFDRPYLLLWLGAVLAVYFIVKKLKDPHPLPVPAPVNFTEIQKHRVTPHAPWVKNEHIGHDADIDRLLQSIDRDLRLSSKKKFLGAYLIAGPRGTGKSQLAQLLGQILFGRNQIIEFDFKNLDDDSFGDQFLEMLESIAENPHQLIVLENLDSASPAMLEPLLAILKSNQWVEDGRKDPILFSGCIFLATIAIPSQADRTWLDQEDRLDYRFASHCSEVICWSTLSNFSVATILGKQLQEYWREHSVQLEYVAPEMILNMIRENQNRRDLGMHPYPAQIRQRSARALEKILLTSGSRSRIELDATGNFKFRGAA